MTKDTIADKIELLISYAKMHLLLQDTDEDYVRNKLLDYLDIDMPSYPTEDVADLYEQIVNPIAQYALSINKIEASQKEKFVAKLIDIVMPPPSSVIDHFDRLCAYDGMRTATNWLYQFGCYSDYIKIKDIQKNIIWLHTGTKGDIVITINLSKPEKDNKAVAAALYNTQCEYPQCLLCPANVGHSGKSGKPPKNTLRTIPIFLGEELWHFQFSPYGYFSQHCIALSNQHKPMFLNNDSFERMLEFVTLFPHYFIGSNAPLPIVGGSILTHDHYQGGDKVHPLFRRPVKAQYKHPSYEGVKFGIVDWYNSVIRVKSKNKETLLAALNHIHTSWNNYSDKSQDIIAKTDNQHNTITPIMRMERGEIFAEIILRNNRTDAAHPFGIFHPTEDMHNIKKEGIGVIEVMGTFILPGRLASELHSVAYILNGKKPFNEKELSCTDNPLHKHRFMIADLLIKNNIVRDETKASQLITQYVNNVCEKILNCTAVFKNTQEGTQGFDKFMQHIGFIPLEKDTTLPTCDTNANIDIKVTETQPADSAPKKRGRPKKVID